MSTFNLTRWVLRLPQDDPPAENAPKKKAPTNADKTSGERLEPPRFNMTRWLAGWEQE